MVLCRWYWVIAGTLVATGTLIFASTIYVMGSPWRLLGLTLILLGGTTANTGFIARRGRSMDEEFEAGYRVGFRQGRRAGKPVVVGIDSGRNRGRVQEAPLRAVAGNGADARRAQADAD